MLYKIPKKKKPLLCPNNFKYRAYKMRWRFIIFFPHTIRYIKKKKNVQNRTNICVERYLTGRRCVQFHQSNQLLNGKSGDSKKYDAACFRYLSYVINIVRYHLMLLLCKNSAKIKFTSLKYEIWIKNPKNFINPLKKK